jgi:hypothetical protein
MRGASLFLVALAVWPSEARASDKSVETWQQLWTRCRIAVEQSERVNVEGLNDLGTAIRRVAPIIAEGLAEPVMAGYELHEHRWQQPNSSFVLVEEDNQGSRRFCAVRLAPDAPAVTSVEEARFSSAFLQARQSLVAAGTHEERNPDPIFSTNLGVGAIARDDNGCRVISTLQIETRPGTEPFFTSFSGEQAGCLPRP